MYRTKFLLNDYPVAAYADAGPPSVDSGFISGVLPAGWAYTRADSVATDCVYMDGSTVTTYTTFNTNQPRLLPFGLLLEPSRTNYFLNSEAPTPGSKPITLALGTYTMWYLGTAAALLVTAGTAVMIPSTGNSTPGVPYTFQVTTAGTVNVSVLTNVLRVQIENGPDATSYIPTGATAVTRAEERLVQNFSAGFLNASQGTYWVEFMLATASMPPNPAAARLFTAGGGSFTSNNNTDQIFFTNTGSNAAFGSTYNASGGGVTTTFIVPPKVGNVSRAAMSVSPTRNQIAMDYVLGIEGAATYRPPSLLAVTLGNGGNPAGAPQAFNGYIRGFKYWPVAMPDAELKECTGAGYYGTGTPVADFDFSTGVFPRRWTYNRSLMTAALPTNSLQTDAPGSTFTTFAATVPRLTPNGILLEINRANFAYPSNPPVSGQLPQAVTANGLYCAWMIGTGSVTINPGTMNAGYSGLPLTITQGNPGVYLSGGTAGGAPSIVVSGSVNRMQIESVYSQTGGNGLVGATPPTSYIANTAASNQRGNDTITIPGAGWMQTANVTYLLELNEHSHVNNSMLMAIGNALTDYDRLFHSQTGTLLPAFQHNSLSYSGGAILQNATSSSGTTTYGQPTRLAVAMSADAIKFYVNGQAIATQTTPPYTRTVPNGAVVCLNGVNNNLYANYAAAAYKRWRYWDFAMTDAQLSALTDITYVPSLDLSLTGPTLDTRFTFLRAAPATYFDVNGIIQTVAIHTPRFGYDPVTHAARGLLIEDARTNLALQNGDFTNAIWTKTLCTLTAGTAGPNGATTGSGLISNNGSVGVIQQIVAVTAGTAYTASVFAKAGSLTSISILMPSGWWADATVRAATFQLGAGNVAPPGTGGGTSTTMTDVGNGWYRCSLTATPDTSGSLNLHFAHATAVGNGVSVQNYVWGAQFEAGNFPTSYIPTTAAAAIRYTDQANMPLTGGWFNSQQGTLVVNGTMGPLIGANMDVCDLDDTTAANNYIMRCQTISNVLAVVQVSGNTNSVTANTVSSITSGVPFKGGFTYNNGVITACMNGGPVASATGVVPISLNRLNMGWVRQAAMNGWKSRVQYFPRAMTADQLQQVTT